MTMQHLGATVAEMGREQRTLPLRQRPAPRWRGGRAPGVLFCAELANKRGRYGFRRDGDQRISFCGALQAPPQAAVNRTDMRGRMRAARTVLVTDPGSFKMNPRHRVADCAIERDGLHDGAQQVFEAIDGRGNERRQHLGDAGASHRDDRRRDLLRRAFRMIKIDAGKPIALQVAEPGAADCSGARVR